MRNVFTLFAVADLVNIHSRKYDGRIGKSWKAELVERTDDLLLFKGIFEFDVDHRKLGFIRRGTVSYEYYWLEKWYNIFRFHEPDGLLRNFYCNVSTPPTFSQGTLEYVDLDIDVLVDPNLNYEVLDLDEFEERTVGMGYPDDLVKDAHLSLATLIELIESRKFPFDRSA